MSSLGALSALQWWALIGVAGIVFGIYVSAWFWLATVVALGGLQSVTEANVGRKKASRGLRESGDTELTGPAKGLLTLALVGLVFWGFRSYQAMKAGRIEAIRVADCRFEAGDRAKAAELYKQNFEYAEDNSTRSRLCARIVEVAVERGDDKDAECWIEKAIDGGYRFKPNDERSKKLVDQVEKRLDEQRQKREREVAERRQKKERDEAQRLKEQQQQGEEEAARQRDGKSVETTTDSTNAWGGDHSSTVGDESRSAPSLSSSSATGDIYVRGYYRKDGTYVHPYYRTAPDSTTRNNYSTRPNINPHTGSRGTRR